jgi:hypothetical protein
MKLKHRRQSPPPTSGRASTLVDQAIGAFCARIERGARYGKDFAALFKREVISEPGSAMEAEERVYFSRPVGTQGIVGFCATLMFKLIAEIIRNEWKVSPTESVTWAPRDGAFGCWVMRARRPAETPLIWRRRRRPIS